MALIDLYYPGFGDSFENLHCEVLPPQGLLILAALIREVGHEVRFTDFRLVQNIDDTLERLWADRQPAMICVSMVTQLAPGGYYLVNRARGRFPDIPIVVGGPHVTAYRSRVLEECQADVAVRNEAEPILRELVELLLGSGRHAMSSLLASSGRLLPNTLARGRCGPVDSDETLVVEDLDSLPFPAWDLVDLTAYHNRRSMATGMPRKKYATVISSRGCPYHCSYCHSIFGKKQRFISIHRFVDDIERLATEHKVDTIYILDDIFNTDKGRVIDISKEILRRNLKLNFGFPNGLRSDRLDEETIDALHAMGTKYICFAIESGSPRIQMEIRKHLDLAGASKAITYADRRGIIAYGFFMFGFPSETISDIQATIRFAERSHLHGAVFFLLAPYKGSEIGDNYQVMDSEDYHMYNYITGRAHVSSISWQRLHFMRHWALLRFWANPWRLRRALELTPDITSLTSHVTEIAALTCHGLSRRLTEMVGTFGKTRRSD